MQGDRVAERRRTSRLAGANHAMVTTLFMAYGS